MTETSSAIATAQAAIDTARQALGDARRTWKQRQDELRELLSSTGQYTSTDPDELASFATLKAATERARDNARTRVDAAETELEQAQHSYDGAVAKFKAQCQIAAGFYSPEAIAKREQEIADAKKELERLREGFERFKENGERAITLLIEMAGTDDLQTISDLYHGGAAGPVPRVPHLFAELQRRAQAEQMTTATLAA